MSTDSRHRQGGSSRGRWVLIVALLAPAVVVPLLVPLYDQFDPTLLGFPFFFWFQFLLILCSAMFTIAAYGLSLVAGRRTRGEGR